MTIKPLDGVSAEDRGSYVSFYTYYYYWKKNYPKLKVHKPAEDICQLCFRFANRHKYLSRSSTGAVAENAEEVTDAAEDVENSIMIPSAIDSELFTEGVVPTQRSSRQRKPRDVKAHHLETDQVSATLFRINCNLLVIKCGPRGLSAM